MRTLTLTAATLSLSLMLLSGRTVIATPSAVDEFAYPAGDLNNENGGSGFSDAWTQTAISGGPLSGSGVVVSPGLTYPGLQTSGGAVTLTTPVTGTVSNDYNTTTYSRDLYLSSPLASPTGTGTTAYYSFLIRADSVGTFSGAEVIFADGNADLNVGSTPGIGGNYWGMSDSGTNQLPSTTRVSSSTTLLVVEADFAGGANGPSDTFKLFVNPTPGMAEPNSPDVTLTGQGNQSPFTNILLYAYGSEIESDSYTFDELRIGTSYSAVTPVPEPATLSALLVLAPLASFLSRSRFRSATSNLHPNGTSASRRLRA